MIIIMLSNTISFHFHYPWSIGPSTHSECCKQDLAVCFAKWLVNISQRVYLQDHAVPDWLRRQIILGINIYIYIYRVIVYSSACIWWHSLLLLCSYMCAKTEFLGYMTSVLPQSKLCTHTHLYVVLLLLYTYKFIQHVHTRAVYT